MTIKGHIHNGEIVPDEKVDLPEGAAVEIVLVERTPAQEADDAPDPDEPLEDMLARFAGKAAGLPPDMAINRNHYLHGGPKRQP